MVIELKTSSGRITSALLLASFTLLSAWFIAVPWALSFSIPDIPNDPDLLRSWRHHPASPQYRHQFLGRIHQYSLTHQDYREALHHYRLALPQNPLSSRTWFDLAKTYWWMGGNEEANRVLKLALRFNPSNVRLRWESALFQVQLGGYGEAADNLKYLIKIDRNERSSYFALLRALTTPTDLIEAILPQDREVLSDYLAYLIARGEAADAQAVWKRLDQTSRAAPDSRLALAYIDLMIAKKMISEAESVWLARRRNAGLQRQGDSDNLVMNGGFEYDDTFGAGLDWRFRSGDGAQVGIDPSNSKEGKRSVKISFDGSQNLDFSGIWQVVWVKPNARYILSGNIRTRGLTTSNGVRIEAYDLFDGRIYGGTQDLVGDHEWSQLSTSFRTMSQTRGIVVRVRREASEKLDNLIAGTAWIDEVHLKQIP